LARACTVTIQRNGKRTHTNFRHTNHSPVKVHSTSKSLMKAREVKRSTRMSEATNSLFSSQRTRGVPHPCALDSRKGGSFFCSTSGAPHAVFSACGSWFSPPTPKSPIVTRHSPLHGVASWRPNKSRGPQMQFSAAANP
jgi:hypothetical protein